MLNYLINKTKEVGKFSLPLFLIFLSLKTQGQELQPFVKTNYNDKAQICTETENDIIYTNTQFAILANQEYDISCINFYNKTDYSLSKICLESKPDSVSIFSSFSGSIEDTIISIVTTNKNGINYCSILKMDVNSKQYNIIAVNNIFNYYHTYKSFINDVGNIIILYANQFASNEYEFVEVNMQGAVIRQLSINASALINAFQFDSNVYMIQSHLGGYILVNNSLSSYVFSFTNQHYYTANAIKTSDSTIISSGIVYNNQPNIPVYQSDFISEFNVYNGTTQQLYNDTLYSGIGEHMIVGNLGIDMKYKNSIYLSNNINLCGYSTGSCIDCESMISLICLDSNYNVKWSKIFDGAAYYSNQVFALNDTGVILTAVKYPNLDAENCEYDMYALKFDKDGSIDENFNHPITGVRTPNFLPIDFSIYPNPSSGVYNVIFSSNSTEIIEFYNTTGKLVLKQKIKNGDKIDLQDYPSDIYFYKITQNSSKLISGKIIKY